MTTTSKRAPVARATYEQELLTAARAVARLQTKRRALRRQLKEVEALLRHERRMLRALANRNDERRPDVMPSRLFGGATGYAPTPLTATEQDARDQVLNNSEKHNDAAALVDALDADWEQK